jgi:hypothetical protein
MDVEKIAEVAHEANRAYQRVLGETPDPSWPETTQVQREAARMGVNTVLEHGGGAQHQHEAWLVHKVAMGWSWGPVKDPNLKTHPNLVPWAEVPAVQKKKDELWLGVVRALLKDP